MSNASMANSGPTSSNSDTADLRAQTLYHGTRADLQVGDLIAPVYRSNYGKRKKATYVYLSAALDAATWGAELAVGDGPGRIYIVEVMGEIFDDTNLTDKKFPGNPTKSYRSREPLKVVGEVMDRQAKKKLLWTSVSTTVSSRRITGAGHIGSRAGGRTGHAGSGCHQENTYESAPDHC
ncbi:NAD(+)--rifampin ADP-ribosyltransferase [Undibacterium sp. TC9W]|uniref:NAD(+)--rifampin ADP-ribosyltransferase n=1 Tax=Undibacterium sp. TC9W TaxID=3413053 RepID=UPI003BF44681